MLIFILTAFFLSALSILIYTLRCHVPPMMSSPQAMVVITKIVPDGNETIYELGSGWGNLLFAFARKYPHRRIIGYELSPLPWLISYLIKFIFRYHNVEIYRKDFLKISQINNAVIVTYLYTGAMQRIIEIIDSGQWKPSILISNSYALPGKIPDSQFTLSNVYRNPVFIYKFDSLVKR